jgi:hypothetical protein
MSLRPPIQSGGSNLFFLMKVFLRFYLKIATLARRSGTARRRVAFGLPAIVPLKAGLRQGGRAPRNDTIVALA